ncbi:MAG: hypothetical protein H7096_01375 [Flavobacterium sp.]|nr:hypothetical protein [Pedobacter sp.]
MIKQYKYSLDKSSKKFICPQCGKKTFVRFIETESGIFMQEAFGRCDRETNCSYYQMPEKDIKPVFTIHQQKPKPSYVPIELLSIMYTEGYARDYFSDFLKARFSLDDVFRVTQLYFITGTNKPWDNSTVFWQIDHAEKIRAGKVMQYHPTTGKRIKVPYNRISWIHKSKDGFNMSQCLFGLHQINGAAQKSIAIVESEKTAVLLSIYKPEYIWMATGAKGNFKYEILQNIKTYKIIAFPDKGEFTIWNTKALALNKIGFNIYVNDWLEKTDYPTGTDLADVYLSAEKD